MAVAAAGIAVSHGMSSAAPEAHKVTYTVTTTSDLMANIYYVTADPHVITTSGSDRHPILKPTERPGAAVAGTVFAISAADLAAADEYEVDDYRRIAVPLRSGGQAWVYVFAG